MSDCLSILAPEIERRGEGFMLLAKFELCGEAEQVEIAVERWPELPDPVWAGQASVALALPIAMSAGVPLQVGFAVSPRLLPSLQDLQEILSAWDDSMSVIEVRGEAMAEVPPIPDGGGCGTFFSGGVDSCFTLEAHQGEIERAVFVHGFDIALEDTALREETSAHLRKVTEAHGVELVEVVTDVRALSDRYCHWGSNYCGAALAAVAHAFGGGLGRVYIPATMSLAHLGGFGTHPMLDPKWSTEAVEIVHDSVEKRRIDKIRALSDISLQHLRVCWENREGKYNCGRCEKCLRTLANLRALGMTDRCPTFDRELDLDALAAMELDHPLVEAFLIETREEAEGNSDKALADAIGKSLANYHAKRLHRELRECGDSLYRAANFDKVARRVRDRVFEDAWRDDPDWVVKEVGKLLPEHRDALFEAFWSKERKWLLPRALKERLRRILPWGRKGGGE